VFIPRQGASFLWAVGYGGARVSALVARLGDDDFELTVDPRLNDAIIGTTRRVRLGLGAQSATAWRLRPPTYSDPIQEAEAGLAGEAATELTDAWDRLLWAEDTLATAPVLARDDLDKLCAALNLVRLVLHETPDRQAVLGLDPYDLVSAVVADILESLME